MIIIVDSHSIGHMLKHKLFGLTYGEKQTGIVFGFFRNILSLSTKYYGAKFVFVWDSQHSIRKKMYSKYKARYKKEQTAEEILIDSATFRQFLKLRTLYLPLCGFRNIFYSHGYEADDIIASIIKREKNEAFLIVSKDNDLLQLLSSTVKMYFVDKKEEYGEKEFVRDRGIVPEQWIDVKSIAGCTSDTVPGIKGVGEETAIKYLRGELPSHYKSYSSIVDGKDVIERNRALVSLPLEGCPEFRIQEDNLSFAGFEEISRSLGFNSFLNDRKWKRFFSKSL